MPATIYNKCHNLVDALQKQNIQTIHIQHLTNIIKRTIGSSPVIPPRYIKQLEQFRLIRRIGQSQNFQIIKKPEKLPEKPIPEKVITPEKEPEKPTEKEAITPEKEPEKEAITPPLLIELSEAEREKMKQDAIKEVYGE